MPKVLKVFTAYVGYGEFVYAAESKQQVYELAKGYFTHFEYDENGVKEEYDSFDEVSSRIEEVEGYTVIGEPGMLGGYQE